MWGCSDKRQVFGSNDPGSTPLHPIMKRFVSIPQKWYAVMGIHYLRQIIELKGSN